MRYFVIFLILIGFAGTAFGQYIGDKIPPGTIYDQQSDSNIFPNDYFDFYYSDSFQQYSLTSGSYQYDVPYKITNGTLTKMDVNCNNVELTLEIESTDDHGLMTVILPRYLIDAKSGNESDDVFIVLQNSYEVQFNELNIIDAKLRILLIPFSSDTSKIRIIGTNYPEAVGENACNEKHEPPLSYLISPLRQFNSGILISEIQCREELTLITKSYDGSPACVTLDTKQKLVEKGWAKLIEYKTRNNYDGIRNHPTVKAFYAKYPNTIEEVRSDHISYVTGSDDGFKVRMKLYFDEKYELDHIDFHCYFQREHQNDVPESFILRYLKDFECEKRPALAVVIIPYGSANPENQPHLIPEEITVVLGKNSTVHWTNNDVVPSTLTSDSPGWSTGMIKPGKSAYVKFNETGVYPYHGQPHPWKKGKVIVLDGLQ